MLRLVARLSILVPLCSIGLVGCSGEKQPEADPNWKVATDPSKVAVPAEMKKMAPRGKGALPPGTK